ncbi:MAG: chorismate synthase [Flavobacteriales bacterium]|jgi:chorismate synthase
MAANTFGHLFRVTTFGESHGPAIGGVIDGCPAGLPVDMAFIASEMRRRKPGQSAITTPRVEDDEVEILSGVFEGRTTGTPIGFLIKNKDQKSSDYDALKEVNRPGHADFTYNAKYGIRDHRGSGRASARETAARVFAGAMAKLYLLQKGISVSAYVHSVHDISIEKPLETLDLSLTEQSIVRCPDAETAEKMIALIEKMRDEGDSVGGTIVCVCKGVPAGLGEPVFDKLHAQLGHAILSINAVKGFEIGDGFASTMLKGSENNDSIRDGIASNHDGGIQGGISNGKDIIFKAAFKPVSTIAKEQTTTDIVGNTISLKAKGRHDPCVLPRAVPIVEAMAALVIMDNYLLNKVQKETI